ncbi:hypothetical protein D9M68_972970 [compost metagenome]
MRMTDQSQLERGRHSSPIAARDQGKWTPFVPKFDATVKLPIGEVPGGQPQAQPAGEEGQPAKGGNDAELADAG